MKQPNPENHNATDRLRNPNQSSSRASGVKSNRGRSCLECAATNTATVGTGQTKAIRQAPRETAANSDGASTGAARRSRKAKAVRINRTIRFSERQVAELTREAGGVHLEFSRAVRIAVDAFLAMAPLRADWTAMDWYDYHRNIAL